MKTINTLTLAGISITLIVCINLFRERVDTLNEYLKTNIFDGSCETNLLICGAILLIGFVLSSGLFIVSRKLTKIDK